MANSAFSQAASTFSPAVASRQASGEPGASGSYKVVRLLPSDGDDYQYRIKNPGEAFERVAKESQLEVEH